MGRRKLVDPGTEYIAQELRAQAARKRMTLDEIARAAGVSRATAHRYLRGESAISVEAVVPFALALGLDPVVLLQGAIERMRE